MRVRGHPASKEMSRLDNRLHLVVEQLLTETAGYVAVHAAGGGELDYVGALRDLLTRGAAAVVRLNKSAGWPALLKRLNLTPAMS